MMLKDKTLTIENEMITYFLRTKIRYIKATNCVTYCLLKYSYL